MSLTACTSCMDAGFVMWDGTARACVNCDAGHAWEERRRGNISGAGNSEGRDSLPPGGDVLLAQARRAAAGLPVGALEERLPVRGVVSADAMAEAALAVEEARMLAKQLSSALAALLADAADKVPHETLIERWTPAVEGLPEWAEPAIRKTGTGRVRKASAAAAPLTP